jgi:hypothetical protein
MCSVLVSVNTISMFVLRKKQQPLKEIHVLVIMHSQK